MGGPLGQAFGLCANEFSPSDGSIVTLDHGCGAHSDAEPEPVAVPVVGLVVDDKSPDTLDTAELTDAEVVEAQAEAEDAQREVEQAQAAQGDAAQAESEQAEVSQPTESTDEQST